MHILYNHILHHVILLYITPHDPQLFTPTNSSLTHTKPLENNQILTTTISLFRPLKQFTNCQFLLTQILFFISWQRVRTEYLKKQDQSRREAEDKVSYLLQQLRSAEGKISRFESQSSPEKLVEPNRAQSRPTTSQQMILSPASTGQEGEAPSRSSSFSASLSVPRIVKRMTDNGLSTSILSLHNHSKVTDAEKDTDKGTSIQSLKLPDNSTKKRNTDTDRDRDVDRDTDRDKERDRPDSAFQNSNGSHHHEKNIPDVCDTMNVPQQIQVEVVRRWEVEKERREQMENRNRELNKELRGLKQQLKALDLSSKWK